MQISTRQIGNATIVDVVGDITLYNSPEMRKVLLDLLKVKHVVRVIVNLERVKYIDSAGMASLVEGLKLSRDLKVRVCALRIEPHRAAGPRVDQTHQGLRGAQQRAGSARRRNLAIDG